MMAMKCEYTANHLAAESQNKSAAELMYGPMLPFNVVSQQTFHKIHDCSWPLLLCPSQEKKKKAITQLSKAVHRKVMCDVKQGERNRVRFTTDTKGEPVVKQLIKCHSIFDSLPDWQGSLLTTFKAGVWFKSHYHHLRCLWNIQNGFTAIKIKAESAIGCHQETYGFFILVLPQNMRHDAAHSV